MLRKFIVHYFSKSCHYKRAYIFIWILLKFFEIFCLVIQCVWDDDLTCEENMDKELHLPPAGVDDEDYKIIKCKITYNLRLKTWICFRKKQKPVRNVGENFHCCSQQLWKKNEKDAFVFKYIFVWENNQLINRILFQKC